MLQKKTDNTIYNIRNCTLLYIICSVSEIIGIYCATSDELQIKRDFFGMYDEYITDVSTSALNITLPDTRLVSDEVFNTCYFECLIFSVLSNKDLCKYLRNTHFDENQCLSAAMSEFVNLCYNEHVKELSIDIIYYEVLVIINNTSPNATKFELNNQECFKEFTIAFYDKLIAENKSLLSKRKKEEASCTSDARRERIELSQNQDCVFSSYIHTLMLNYDDSALNMDQILTRIIENTSSDELSNSSDYKLSCNMLRIFTNRFELSNEVSRTRQVENFHKEIKTYFAKCFKIGQDLFAFRFAIIYQPTKGMDNAGHYFCLYFDYEIKEFFTINYKERVPISDEQGLDYLFEHSMMVTYERISKEDDSYMNGCYDYLQ